MRRIIGVLALLFLIPSVAHAQVNTERFRKNADANGLSGSVELFFNNRTGNTDLQSAGATLHLGWKHDPHMVLLVGNVNRGEARGEKTINKGFSHLRYNYTMHPKVALELFVQHEYDEFSLLDARTLLGIGPRFTVANGDSWAIFWGVAYMAEWEELDLPPAAPEDPSTFTNRASTYLAIRAELADRVQLTNTVYAQPRIDRASDLRVLEELSLKVGIVGKLSLRISLAVRHDEAPPTGVKPLDTSLSNRLVWDF